MVFDKHLDSLNPLSAATEHGSWVLLISLVFKSIGFERLWFTEMAPSGCKEVARVGAMDRSAMTRLRGLLKDERALIDDIMYKGPTFKRMDALKAKVSDFMKGSDGNGTRAI